MHRNIQTLLLDFHDSIHEALQWPPSYQTVTDRTKLALRLHDSVKSQVSSMGSLVHDEHLMYQVLMQKIKICNKAQIIK